MAMAALLSSPPSPFLPLRFRSHLKKPNPNPNSPWILQRRGPRSRFRLAVVAASNLCEQETLTLDTRSLKVKEHLTEGELLAAVRLRIRTFYEFNQSSYNIEDHQRYLTEREYEALKDRVAGMRIGFRRVACINTTLPLSPPLVSVHELCSSCKFLEDGENRVVVGTLDLNQCHSLADELIGKRPQDLSIRRRIDLGHKGGGKYYLDDRVTSLCWLQISLIKFYSGSDAWGHPSGTGPDLKRAYLSNVCVAKELQRNGLGYALIAKSKEVAREWGITDLYVHVAVDNQAAQKLYEKSGFVYENEEPAWQARFLGRPRRFLLWTNLTRTNL